MLENTISKLEQFKSNKKESMLLIFGNTVLLVFHESKIDFHWIKTATKIFCKKPEC